MSSVTGPEPRPALCATDALDDRDGQRLATTRARIRPIGADRIDNAVLERFDGYRLLEERRAAARERHVQVRGLDDSVGLGRDRPSLQPHDGRHARTIAVARVLARGYLAGDAGPVVVHNGGE